jgi:hypothetical protein
MQAGATLVHCTWVNFVSKNLQNKPRMTFASQSLEVLVSLGICTFNMGHFACKMTHVDLQRNMTHFAA